MFFSESAVLYEGRKFRVKDGKTFKYYMDEFKKKFSAEERANFISDEFCIVIWTSHDTTQRQCLGSDEWPRQLSEWPHWNAYTPGRVLGMEDYRNIDWGQWPSCGVIWEDFNGMNYGKNDMYGVKFTKWLKNAKPGYKIYLAVCLGVRRYFPEERYFEGGRWITPSYTVFQDKALSACTIIVK